jgi:hypothetical protein
MGKMSDRLDICVGGSRHLSERPNTVRSCCSTKYTHKQSWMPPSSGPSNLINSPYLVLSSHFSTAHSRRTASLMARSPFIAVAVPRLLQPVSLSGFALCLHPCSYAPELHSSPAMASVLATLAARRFLPRLPNPWSRCARAALSLPPPSPLTWRPLAVTVAADASRSAGPWRGSPPTSPPTTAMMPHCRWRRRPHLDTSNVGSICSSVLDISKYVVSVSSVCCKSGSGCFTCCNGYTRMFQVYVPNISSVSYVYCKCFIWMLQN